MESFEAGHCLGLLNKKFINTSLHGNKWLIKNGINYLLVPYPQAHNVKLQTSCSSCCDVSKWTMTELGDSLAGETGVLFIIAENSPLSSSNSNGGLFKETRNAANSLRHWQRR